MLDSNTNLKGTALTILHWYQPELSLGSSILGQYQALEVADTSAPAAPYIPPSPSKGTPHSVHKYVILLYKQPPKYSLPDCLRNATLSPAIDVRAAFNLDQFVKAAGLGEPVAASWFKENNTQPASTTYPVTQRSTKSYACGSTPTAQ